MGCTLEQAPLTVLAWCNLPGLLENRSFSRAQPHCQSLPGPACAQKATMEVLRPHHAHVAGGHRSVQQGVVTSG